MEITHSGRVFDLGDPEKALVGETEKFRLYHCLFQGGGEGLLQVATALPFNPNLERAALYLRMLANQAKELDKEYAERLKSQFALKTFTCVWSFPELVDSFTYDEQDGQRINVLSFCDVQKTRNLFPLSSYRERGYRVDLRSTGWMVKKFLRMLSMAHSMGLSVGVTDGSNLLIEPEQHFLILYNWSEARLYSDGTVPEEIVTEEIKVGIQAIIEALGGDWQKNEIPVDPDPLFEEYRKHLLVLARFGAISATSAFEKFGTLISPWQGYHPFQALPL